jgi:hypothetical protein
MFCDLGMFDVSANFNVFPQTSWAGVVPCWSCEQAAAEFVTAGYTGERVPLEEQVPERYGVGCVCLCFVSAPP